MLYEIGGEYQIAQLDRMKPDRLYMGLVGADEIETVLHGLPRREHVLELCRSTDPTKRNLLTAYDGFSFGILDVVQADHIMGTRDRIGLLMQKNLLLVIDLRDCDHSTETVVAQVLEHAKEMKTVTPEKLICDFLTRLTENDNVWLEKTEKKIAGLDSQVLENREENFNTELSVLRRELLVMHGYYEHLVRIGEDLYENENDLFEESGLHYFKLFTGRAQRLADNVQMLREFAQQVREAYQAALDNRLNNIMKIFTVVTTVFLPLTLLTGWYGMNFVNMPELKQPWAYPVVCGLSVVIVLSCLYWFKKKKLL